MKIEQVVKDNWTTRFQQKRWHPSYVDNTVVLQSPCLVPTKNGLFLERGDI